MSGYVCEHGDPCEAGGFTDCPQCPRDPQRVRYRPTPEAHARTMAAHAAGPAAALADVRALLAAKCSCGHPRSMHVSRCTVLGCDCGRFRA